LSVARATLRLIDRNDLLAALDRAAAKKVTIISAPVGSGKTSLLRAWADRPGQPRRLAVVQVQRDQQDAQQFWLALLSAVRDAAGTTSGAEPPAATPDFKRRCGDLPCGRRTGRGPERGSQCSGRHGPVIGYTTLTSSPP
jgi:hypothetical protein